MQIKTILYATDFSQGARAEWIMSFRWHRIMMQSSSCSM